MFSLDGGRQDVGGFFGGLRARAQAVPDQDEDDGEEKNDGGDGVDFGGDAAAQARPDFERQGVAAADEEKAYGDFVERESEDEESGGNYGDAEIGESDAPESDPVIGA